MMLKEKILISTVSADKSSRIREIFEPLGAAVVDFPMTEIQSARLSEDENKALKTIKKYHWIIFTSPNGVIHFYKLLKETTGISGIPSGIKTAAIGIKTASELEKRGRKPDYTGKGSTSEDLANELSELDTIKGYSILLPLGNLATTTLEEKLKSSANVLRINVYDTVMCNMTNTEPANLISENRYHMVLFTSPSGVSGLADALGDEISLSSIRAASIGKVTSAAAEQYGIRCLVTAARSTYEGLAEGIVNYYTTKI
jgi:uroporphyrinogen-III synthase